MAIKDKIKDGYRKHKADWKESVKTCWVFTGFVQIFGSKIQDFFHTFSKTRISQGYQIGHQYNP